MALPSSGQLAISQISDEFGGGSRSNVSLRSLSSAAGLSTPDGFNEFYGLSAYTPPSYITGANSVSGAGTASNPYILTDTLPSSTFDYDNIFYDGFCDSVSRLYYVVNEMPQRLTFQSQQSVAQKISIQITTWNNNAQSGCPLSNAFLRCDSNFNGLNVNPPSGGSSGASQLLNNVYTFTDNSFSAGQYVYVSIGHYQLYLEEVQRCTTEFTYAEESYDICSSNLSTSAFTVKVWFEPA